MAAARGAAAAARSTSRAAGGRGRRTLRDGARTKSTWSPRRTSFTHRCVEHRPTRRSTSRRCPAFLAGQRRSATNRCWSCCEVCLGAGRARPSPSRASTTRATRACRRCRRHRWTRLPRPERTASCACGAARGYQMWELDLLLARARRRQRRARPRRAAASSTLPRAARHDASAGRPAARILPGHRYRRRTATRRHDGHLALRAHLPQSRRRWRRTTTSPLYPRGAASSSRNWPITCRRIQAALGISARTPRRSFGFDRRPTDARQPQLHLPRRTRSPAPPSSRSANSPAGDCFSIRRSACDRGHHAPVRESRCDARAFWRRRSRSSSRIPVDALTTC